MNPKRFRFFLINVKMMEEKHREAVKKYMDKLLANSEGTSSTKDAELSIDMNFMENWEEWVENEVQETEESTFVPPEMYVFDDEPN